jgi:hypothetical protein
MPCRWSGSTCTKDAEEELAAIGDAVQDPMVSTIGVPADDRFQVITEHRPGWLRHDPTTSALTATTGSCWSRSPWLADVRSKRKRRCIDESPNS